MIDLEEFKNEFIKNCIVMKKDATEQSKIMIEIIDRAITAEKAVEILAEIIENCDDCMDNCPLWYECDKIDIDERESSCANNLKNYAMEKAREQECLKG